MVLTNAWRVIDNMVNSMTIFFLTTSVIISIFALIFSSIMTGTFFKKRTMGSIFMMVAFGMIAFGEIFNSVSYWIGGFSPSNTVAIGILQGFYINFISLSIIYFYYFSTRHILRDNELVRSIAAVLFAESTAVITTTMFTIILGGTMKFPATVEFFLAGTNIYIIAPSYILLLALFVPLFVLGLVRMIFSLFILRKDISDPVARRGTLFINFSVISLALNTLLFIFMELPIVHNYPVLVVFIQLFKIVFTFSTLIFGYLGWILPDWLKKRIRGKAWIVKEWKKLEEKQINYSFSSSKAIKASKLVVEEISEP